MASHSLMGTWAITMQSIVNAPPAKWVEQDTAPHRLLGPEQLFSGFDALQTAHSVREVYIGTLLPLDGALVRLSEPDPLGAYAIPTKQRLNAFEEYFVALQVGAERVYSKLLESRQLHGASAPRARWMYYIHNHHTLVSEFKILGNVIGLRISDQYTLKGTSNQLKNWTEALRLQRQNESLVYSAK